MSDYLFYLLETGFCLALSYLVYWVFLRKETFFTFNRLFLLSTVPLSFIIPLIHMPSPFITHPRGQSSFATMPPAGTEGHHLAISDVLWLIFLIGAGFVLLRFLYRLLCLFLLVKKFGYHQQEGVKIVCMNRNCAPFSFFNFLFLNRSNLSDSDFQRIIAHECIHIKQYHSLDLILMELLTIFQWFNPFVRPYKKSLKETHEYLADNAVIAQGCSKAKYQVLIFEQQVGLKLFEFANNFNHSQIKRRITMMERIKSRGKAKFKVLLILPAIALLLLVFAQPKTAQEPEKAKGQDSDAVIVAPDISHVSIGPKDDDKSDEKKKEMHKKQEELALKEKQLKEELEKTKDPEKRELIKEKLLEIQKMKEEAGAVKVMTDEDFEKKMIELKKAYENTDDPEKKAAIKEKALQLKRMQEEAKKVEGSKKANPVAVGSPEWNKMKKELKELIANTDDPEKKAELKKKLEKMLKMEEAEKKKD